jgi:DNA-directed RNA polymerase subunit RPC12/RpoP
VLTDRVAELEQKCADHCALLNWQARNEAERRASEYKDRCVELEKRLEDAERLVVKTLCSNCNKEYTLSLDNGLSHNFSRCPHCGERNDRWIRIWRG